MFSEYWQNPIDHFLLNEPKLQIEALFFDFEDGTNAVEPQLLALRTPSRAAPPHASHLHTLERLQAAEAFMICDQRVKYHQIWT